jgi:hypothetical protein
VLGRVSPTNLLNSAQKLGDILGLDLAPIINQQHKKQRAVQLKAVNSSAKKRAMKNEPRPVRTPERKESSGVINAWSNPGPGSYSPVTKNDVGGAGTRTMSFSGARPKSFLETIIHSKKDIPAPCDTYAKGEFEATGSMAADSQNGYISGGSFSKNPNVNYVDTLIRSKDHIPSPGQHQPAHGTFHDSIKWKTAADNGNVGAFNKQISKTFIEQVTLS